MNRDLKGQVFISFAITLFVFGGAVLSAQQTTPRMAAAAPKTPAKPPGPVAVAYLVDGYTGCCIPGAVKTYLESKGVPVYVANWNDLERKRNPGSFNPGEVFNSTDEYFIKQMQDAIKKFRNRPR